MRNLSSTKQTAKSPLGHHEVRYRFYWWLSYEHQEHFQEDQISTLKQVYCLICSVSNATLPSNQNRAFHALFQKFADEHIWVKTRASFHQKNRSFCCNPMFSTFVSTIAFGLGISATGLTRSLLSCGYSNRSIKKLQKKTAVMHDWKSKTKHFLCCYCKTICSRRFGRKILNF